MGLEGRRAAVAASAGGTVLAGRLARSSTGPQTQPQQLLHVPARAPVSRQQQEPLCCGRAQMLWRPAVRAFRDQVCDAKTGWGSDLTHR